MQSKRKVKETNNKLSKVKHFIIANSRNFKQYKDRTIL